MVFNFYGMEKHPKLLKFLRVTAENEGHKIGTPADFVFTVWEGTKSIVFGAARMCDVVPRVVPILLEEPEWRDMRALFRTGVVYDILRAPTGWVEAWDIITALEAQDTSELR